MQENMCYSRDKNLLISNIFFMLCLKYKMPKVLKKKEYWNLMIIINAEIPRGGEQKKAVHTHDTEGARRRNMFLQSRESWSQAVKTIWHVPWMEQSHHQMCSGDGQCRKDSAFPLFTVRSSPCFPLLEPKQNNGQESLQDSKHRSQASGVQSRTQRVENEPGWADGQRDQNN